MQQTCMVWGFECGDGWYNLIDALCSLLDWDPKTGGKLENPPVATQVKEKFGTLRFYVSGANEQQHNYITAFEHMSGKICETCGTTVGVYFTKGWIKATCPDCDKPRKKE